MVKTILIADDHHLISDGFKALLQALVPGSNILTSKTAKQVNAYLDSESRIDHIFLDLTLLDAKGLDHVTSLCARVVPEKICVISGENSALVINSCRNLKIGGYIPKSLGEDALLHALSTVLQGKPFFPAQNGDAQNSLSKRQLEVLNRMGQGLTNKEIAQQLGLSDETVKVHVRNLLAMLKAQSRTAAVNNARNEGLI